MVLAKMMDPLELEPTAAKIEKLSLIATSKFSLIILEEGD